jgi:hypothetical protein
MASLLRIKRSGTSGDPSTLGQGELAYSYLPDNGSNGGDRLYIGTGTEIAGNAVNHEVIGGKFFTQMLDHDKGTVTPNSALIVDADSKLNILKVDDIIIDGSSISATGSLTFDTQGNAINLGGVEIKGVATPTLDSDAANKAYVDDQISTNTFTIGADNGSNDTFNTSTGVLTFAGGTGITSTVSDDTLTFNLDNTAVTAGSYGSTTQIPTFTVDAQGRLTAAGIANVATNLTLNGDAISLLDSDVTFTATGNGLTLTYTTSTNTVDYAIDDATTTSKGVAQFLGDDFGVSSGTVSLSDAVVKLIVTDSGSVTPTGHDFNILGSGVQGLDVTGAGSTVTITPRTASYSQLGVAKFESNDFTLNSGDVSLDSAVLKQISTDDGVVPITGHMVSILGGEGINVGHAGTNISIEGEDANASNKGIASFEDTDFNISNGHVSLRAGSVANADLVNDDITIGDTAVALGATLTDLTGLTSAVVDDITINGNVISTNTSTNVLVLDPKSGDSNGGQVLIQGDLVVQGTQTIINSSTLSINDLNIVLADSAADATAANGAGITVNGAGATITYSVAGDKWNTNKDLDVGGEIYRNGVVLREYIEDHLGTSFFAAGEGMDITYGSAQDSDNTILFAAEIASYSNKGVASFDSDQFTVTSGFATIATLDGGTY